MDIAPTVLGLLCLPYTAPFYGEDVLAPRSGPQPLLLNHNHNVDLLLGERLVVLGLNKSTETFRFDAGRNRLEPATEDCELTALATAFYQTAFDLFKNHRYQ